METAFPKRFEITEKFGDSYGKSKIIIVHSQSELFDLIEKYPIDSYLLEEVKHVEYGF